MDQSKRHGHCLLTNAKNKMTEEKTEEYRWQKNPFAISWSKKVGRKASEVFEGPNSSLRKTFDDASKTTDKEVPDLIFGNLSREA